MVQLSLPMRKVDVYKRSKLKSKKEVISSLLLMSFDDPASWLLYSFEVPPWFIKNRRRSFCLQKEVTFIQEELHLRGIHYRYTIPCVTCA